MVNSNCEKKYLSQDVIYYQPVSKGVSKLFFHFLKNVCLEQSTDLNLSQEQKDLQRLIL